MADDIVTSEIDIGANVIAVSMQKGGTGKSTTSINVSGSLADDTDRTTTAGHHVLLVDSDPQGFVTIMFGMADYYTDEDADTMRDLILDVNRWPEVDNLVRTDHPEVDVLPSHTLNFLLEKELWNESRTQKRLGLLLSNLSHDYDYILIDSPPNLGPLADGAALAAGNVLYATKADKIASFSMSLLIRELDTLEKEFGVDIQDIGAAVNMVEDNNISKERIEWFRDRLGEENMTIVPDSVAIEGATDQGGSVFNPYYEPENSHRARMAGDLRDRYDQLGQQVVSHFA